MKKLGTEISRKPEWLSHAVQIAENENRWFTEDNCWQALDAIASQFLSGKVLTEWADRYPISDASMKKVGLVLAGNIPLVGFHDVLAVFISGHHALVKLSSKDRALLTAIYNKLLEIDPAVTSHISLVDRLKDIDAVIATGSNNTSNYFEQYFGKYPNIIRKNRHAVAVLTGKESEQDIKKLGNDIFNYFGLGCRNVSKLYLPDGFDLTVLLRVLHDNYKDIVNHNKYKNNFDYNNALFMLNKVKYLMSGSLIITESPEIASRISTVHYEYYTDVNAVSQQLRDREEAIQVVVSSIALDGIDTVDFGAAQRPTIYDYADGVDTMTFLTTL